MMKIKEIIHDKTPAYQKLSPLERVLLDAIHKLQEDMDLVKTYVNMPKYHVPWGDFKTYSKAAAAYQPMKGDDSPTISWVEVRRRIKDETLTDYYLNV